MKIQVAAIFGFLLLCSLTTLAEEKIYAPLPDRVAAAKTVFLVRERNFAVWRRPVSTDQRLEALGSRG